jgi:hypothetical protein
MKKGLYERYVPDTLLYEGEEGALYRGHDRILRRDILLYIFPRTVAHAERMMYGPSALQVIDRGETADKVFVVLEYIPGLLLSQACLSRKLSLKEALGMARQCLQILQEANRERCRGLLLAKHNLWLTETGDVKIVNSWLVHEAAVGREISDLFRLMHYLLFGEVSIALPMPQVIEEMALSYPGDPFLIRKSLKAIWRREEKKMPEQYERVIAQTLEDITALYQYIKKQESVRTKNIYEEPEELLEPQLPAKRRQMRRTIASSRRWKWSGRKGVMIALVVALCVTGFVLLQNDKPGAAKSTEVVSQNTSVESSEEGKKGVVVVPDVEGLSLAEAGQKLTAVGLRYKYYVESSFSKQGTVFKQSPAAGEQISRIDVVQLWVSE